MSFFVHSPNGTITIDGETFDLDLFMKVFPDYSLPQGMEKRKYIQEDYHYVSDGMRIYHQEVPWHNGDKIISRLKDLIAVRSHWDEAKKLEEQEAENLQFQSKPYQEKRKSEYPPIEDMVIALWEYIVEEREFSTKEIQTLRNSIKQKYPKKDA